MEQEKKKGRVLEPGELSDVQGGIFVKTEECPDKDTAKCTGNSGTCQTAENNKPVCSYKIVAYEVPKAILY
jgi:hypothetical protein